MPLLEMDLALGLRIWSKPYKALSSKLNHRQSVCEVGQEFETSIEFSHLNHCLLLLLLLIAFREKSCP